MDGGTPGRNSESVIDLIKRRLAKPPGAYDDGRRLALIVEGGGMRGVLSAGSLFALDLLGCRDVFDEIYAVSAGGVNAAYFLSGQSELGISVYFDDISSLRFANPLRFWKIVDVDYVYDHIVPHVKTLDEQAIRSARPDFFLGVTDVDNGENVLIDVKASPHSVAHILKASSAIPVLYNRIVALGPRHYVDGGLSDVLPVIQATVRGCTDVLILTTKQGTRVSKRPPLWERLVFLAMIGWRYPAVNRAFVTNFERTCHSRALTMGTQVIDGINIATIEPTPHELVVGRVTLRRDTLVEGAYRMASRTAHALDRSDADIRQAFDRLR